MDWKIMLTVFFTVFVAELGDKTQLATMLFASDKAVSGWTVFIAASLALVLTSALGVLAGTLLSHWINPKTLGLLAGVAFIVIGVLTLIKSW